MALSAPCYLCLWANRCSLSPFREWSSKKDRGGREKTIEIPRFRDRGGGGLEKRLFEEGERLDGSSISLCTGARGHTKSEISDRGFVAYYRRGGLMRVR